MLALQSSVFCFVSLQISVWSGQKLEVVSTTQITLRLNCGIIKFSDNKFKKKELSS